MPPHGFRSITVPEELYRDIKSFFQKEKKFFMRRGIRSLVAWITVTLYKEMEDHTSKKNAQAPKVLEEKLHAIFGAGTEAILKYMLKKHPRRIVK